MVDRCPKTIYPYKNKLYKKYLKIKSSYNECKYKTYRNHLTRVLKCAEKKHYADLVEAIKSNLKKTWNILEEIVDKKKNSRIHDKFKLSGDTVTTDKNVIWEKFYDFFVNIGNNLPRKIPDVNTSPLPSSIWEKKWFSLYSWR